MKAQQRKKPKIKEQRHTNTNTHDQYLGTCIICISSSLPHYSRFDAWNFDVDYVNHLEIRIAIWERMRGVSQPFFAFSRAIRAMRHNILTTKTTTTTTTLVTKEKKNEILTSHHLTLVLNVNAHHSYNPKLLSHQDRLYSVFLSSIRRHFGHFLFSFLSDNRHSVCLWSHWFFYRFDDYRFSDGWGFFFPISKF